MEVREWLGEDNKVGIDIFESKYRYNNETFEEWLDRISNGNEKIRDLIVQKKFLFGGRILSNRGLEKLGKRVTFSNCFNLGIVGDTLEDIFDTAKKMARTYSMGGGVGLNLGGLRPNGAKVNNNAETSTGPIPFAEMFSKVTETIGARGRRGALMLLMPTDHPDIEDFIKSKEDLTKIVKANISVWASDSFMEAALNNEEYDLVFKVEQTGEKIVKTVMARDILKLISEMAYKTGEPGFLFSDTIKSYNLMQYAEEFEITGTNPCGELPLPTNGACLLGSINLSEYVVSPYRKTAYFNFTDFEKDVETYIFALNECLDENVSFMPLKEQEDVVRKYRPIGLGIMGAGDMFIKMNMRYGDNKSIKLIDEIGYCLARNSIIASSKWYGDQPETTEVEDIIKSRFYKNHFNNNEQYIPNNCQILTIAPTGSISTMLGISGGVEALFSEKIWRKTESINEGKETYYEIDAPVIIEWKHYNKADVTPDWITKSTALNLKWDERINIQSTWQKHIDNAISSTINLPEETTVEEIMDLYLSAWKYMLKGVTVFRTNCDRAAILTTEKVKTEEVVEIIEEDEEEIEEVMKWGDTLETSDNLIGLKRKVNTGCGSLHIQGYFDWDGNFRELYLDKGSSGGCFSYSNALSRTISGWARTGASLEKIVDQLNSALACPSYVTRTATKGDTSKGKNCPNAIGNALLDMQTEVNTILCVDSNKKDKIMPKVDFVEYQESIQTLPSMTEQACLDSGLCPVCYKNGIRERLAAGGGCWTCQRCGFSRCD